MAMLSQWPRGEKNKERPIEVQIEVMVLRLENVSKGGERKIPRVRLAV